MPIYEYRCPSCKLDFEELVSSSAAGSKVGCPRCGDKKVQRRLSVFAAHQASPAPSCPAGPCDHCAAPMGACQLS